MKISRQQTISFSERVYSLSLLLFCLFSNLLALGCGGTESNGVMNSTNANRSNSSNTATVVNVNNNSIGSTTNRWVNKNSVTRAQYNARRAEYESEKGSSTIGQGANDSWLWFKTRAALLTTNDLRESTINVDVVNDVVTLKGTVETRAQKTKAEQVAKGIDGVKSVKNELKVALNDFVISMNTNSVVNGNKSSNMNTITEFDREVSACATPIKFLGQIEGVDYFACRYGQTDQQIIRVKDKTLKNALMIKSQGLEK
jgi:hypothetical protein